MSSGLSRREWFARTGLLAATCSLGVPAHGASYTDEFLAQIPDLLNRYKVPGLGVAAIENGAVRWVKPFGIRSAESNAPVTEDTVFEAGWLGMPVFACGVMRLAEEGRLDLDKPLADYTDLSALSTDARVRSVTGRIVLAQRSGILHGEELLFEAEPGANFGYAPMAYRLLQQAVEAIAGKSLDAFMAAYVFEAIEMNRSGYAWRADFEGDHAVAHDRRSLPLAKAKGPQAHAAFGLHCSIADYARFLAGLLSVNPSSTGRLSMAGVEAMLTRASSINETMGWGLGWGLQSTEAGEAFWQWGDNGGGFRSFATGSLETRGGLAILTNSYSGLRLAEDLVTRYVGGSQPCFDWMKKAFYDPRKMRPGGEAPAPG